MSFIGKLSTAEGDRRREWSGLGARSRRTKVSEIEIKGNICRNFIHKYTFRFRSAREEVNHNSMHDSPHVDVEGFKYKPLEKSMKLSVFCREHFHIVQ